MLRFLAATAFSLALLAGCNEPSARLNAPPHGEPVQTVDSQGTYVYMMDNAMLADMTMTDAHFLPHRAMLNNMGVERLSRMAQLIQAYGGGVRMNTEECDEGLVNQRMQSVREFLTEAGVLVASQSVTCDMAGGAGMNATEAMTIRASEGTYKPKAGGSGNAPPPSNSSGSSQK
jgi:hypothetical protein